MLFIITVIVTLIGELFVFLVCHFLLYILSLFDLHNVVYCVMIFCVILLWISMFLDLFRRWMNLHCV